MHFANDDYSSDGFKRIVLLGLSYCPEDSDCDCGMDFIDFYRDYYTRIWITYRTGMPAFSGTQDCPSAPLGIHRLVEISSADDPSKNAVGRWYAPSEVISLMRRALRQSASPLTSDLSLMLAVDGRVTVGDAERESRAWAKRLLLFVPLRLGTSSVNPVSSSWSHKRFEAVLVTVANVEVYHDHIRHMLSLESCLGILGGKPDHSLYFIGYYGRNVIYLDPHVAHEYIPMSSWDEPSTTMDGVTEGQQHQVVDVDLGPGEGSKRTRDPLFTVQYQETTDFDYVGKASEEERRQALEHGFELL
ncbi:peptidase family C54 [Ancylostoma ceylanicum]|uniref:Cysteine protease n=1 Tax=Ancylostoma ceylanicum TaxID=53326 RepID=A0A0D6LG18_9BILA|nr:peptidase family C54 [Ancylostoma ceylanicum]